MASTEGTQSQFEKAKSLFSLKEADPATERNWELYIVNRLGAAKFPGCKDLKPVETKDRAKAAKEEDGSDDEEDEEEEDDDEEEDEEPVDSDYSWNYGDPDELIVLNAIRETLRDLEFEMDKERGVIQQSFKLLSCNAAYEEVNDPRTVKTLTRLYSPTRPTYVDVHLSYHCRTRLYEVEWFYRLGFKLYTRLEASDYAPAAVKQFEKGTFEGAYSSNGWRTIAYGYYDDIGEYGAGWKRAERRAFRMGRDEILDVYEALWGPLKDLPEGANEVAKIQYRREMVNTVRILLAAVGINYDIAVVDGEEDEPSDVYRLEGLCDKWVAREARKACGFQLKDDAANEIKGREELQEELTRPADEYYDDDDDFF